MIRGGLRVIPLTSVNVTTRVSRDNRVVVWQITYSTDQLYDSSRLYGCCVFPLCFVNTPRQCKPYLSLLLPSRVGFMSLRCLFRFSNHLCRVRLFSHLMLQPPLLPLPSSFACQGFLGSFHLCTCAAHLILLPIIFLLLRSFFIPLSSHISVIFLLSCHFTLHML